MNTVPPPRPAWQYTLTARLLHWIVAAFIVVLLGLGWYMMTVEHQPGAGSLFNLHKSLGMTVGILVVVRVLWRAAHRPAPLPATVPRWQTGLAHATEWALYVCMVAMPLTGYLGASHQKHPPLFFGLPTPAWTAPDHDVAERFFDVHGVIAWIIVALVALHVAGALRHLLIDRDGVFQRMSLGRARR